MSSTIVLENRLKFAVSRNARLFQLSGGSGASPNRGKCVVAGGDSIQAKDCEHCPAQTAEPGANTRLVVSGERNCAQWQQREQITIERARYQRAVKNGGQRRCAENKSKYNTGRRAVPEEPGRDLDVTRQRERPSRTGQKHGKKAMREANFRCQDRQLLTEDGDILPENPAVGKQAAYEGNPIGK